MRTAGFPSVAGRAGRRPMAVLLLILGVVVAACGLATIGFGVSLSESTLGTGLLCGGATALTGGFILIDRATNETAAAGMIAHGLRRATNVHRHGATIDREAHAALKHQKPAILWFTGLSGAGKSTIANLVEAEALQGRALIGLAARRARDLLHCDSLARRLFLSCRRHRLYSRAS